MSFTLRQLLYRLALADGLRLALYAVLAHSFAHWPIFPRLPATAGAHSQTAGDA